MKLPRKRLLVTVGAAGVVALGVGGVTVAYAGDGGSDDDEGGDHHFVGSIKAPPENEADDDEQSETSESDEAAQLQPLATIDAQQAQDAARAAVPGTVETVELGNEDGYVVYEVKITTADGVVEVKIDAGDATVLAQEVDDEDEGETGDQEEEGPESAE